MNEEEIKLSGDIIKIDWAQSFKGTYILPECTNEYLEKEIDPHFKNI